MVAAWWPRDVLEVAGPDAVSFIQGQVSQDVAALAVGEARLSFVLQPQGKVDALVRITRRAEDALVIDVDGGFGPAVADRLARFKLRVKAQISTLPWRCVAVRGTTEAEAPAGGLAVPAWWPGMDGVDLLGEEPAVPAGAELVEPAELEALRIAAGMPAMGRELTDRTIPAESGLVDAAVSFTKGCFTGQELVARIDSRGGHVPRHLRSLVIDSPVVPPAGAKVMVDDHEVGALTSAAPSVRTGEVVALAYIRREVEAAPSDATVRWDGGEAEAHIQPWATAS